MADLHLISFAICPYVERARIVLLEKGLPFRESVVDLSNKPEWFLRLSPRGKVPVLVVDGEPVYESSVINEFLDELAPNPPLLPADLIGRAKARAWIAFNNDGLFAALGKMWFGPQAAIAAAQIEVDRALSQLEAQLATRSAGPYFMGQQFSLVDASFAPGFARRNVSVGLGFGDPFAAYPLVAAYADAVLARPSAHQAQVPDLTSKVLTYIAQLRARQA